MVWHLRPTEASYTHCITGSFGPPFSAYFPTCVEKLIKFQQSGEKNVRSVVIPGWWAFIKLQYFSSYSCVIVTNEKIASELPIRIRAEHWLWSNNVDKTKWLCCCLTGIQTKQMVDDYVIYVCIYIYSFFFIGGDTQMIIFWPSDLLCVSKCVQKISSEIRENKHTFLLSWCTRSISERLKKKHPVGNDQGNMIMCARC